MKIYMAGPLFTVAERLFNAELARRLRRAGFVVWLPQERDAPSPRGLHELALQGIAWADVVLACADGADVDSGTAAECGYAVGIGRPVVAYRTDLRAGGDGGEGEPDYNLVIAGLASVNVQMHFRAADPVTMDAVAAQLIEVLRGPALREIITRVKRTKKIARARRPGRR